MEYLVRVRARPAKRRRRQGRRCRAAARARGGAEAEHFRQLADSGHGDGDEAGREQQPAQLVDVGAHLQTHVWKAATACIGGCNRVRPRLQP
eukprot:scaffold63258_cov59-Phaeocystis_antarctica.AAC.5